MIVNDRFRSLERLTSASDVLCQLWRKLCRDALQLFVKIEQRRQNNQLGTRFPDVPQALRTLRRRSPQRHAFVLTATVIEGEPLRQSVAGALFVVVNGNVDTFGDRKTGRITVSLFQVRAQRADLVGEVAGWR